MKSIILTALGLFIMGTTVNAATPGNIKVDAKSSNIKWEASKIVGSHHHGTVALKDGVLRLENNKVTGGTFTINMPSITNDDLTGDMKATLEKHLKSNDFFAVDSFPVSTFVFTNVEAKKDNNYTITGNLTIRDKTKAVSFDATVKTNADGSKIITTQRFSIDRTQWNIIYGSGSFFKELADKAISNDVYFEITIAIPK